MAPQRLHAQALSAVDVEVAVEAVSVAGHDIVAQLRLHILHLSFTLLFSRSALRFLIKAPSYYLLRMCVMIFTTIYTEKVLFHCWGKTPQIIPFSSLLYEGRAALEVKFQEIEPSLLSFSVRNTR